MYILNPQLFNVVLRRSIFASDEILKSSISHGLIFAAAKYAISMFKMLMGGKEQIITKLPHT